jgi:Ribonuclease G/E
MEAQTIQCQRCNGDGEEYVDLHPVRCGGCQGTGRITDDSPLCAEVATIPIEDIQVLISIARMRGPDAAADRVETWLKESVGDSIPW